MSDAFGGIGSVAISAVPVFEKTKATCGNALTVFSTSSCIACDCARPVLGIRSACMAMFFSSSVGMNSWPSLTNTSTAAANIRRRTAITGVATPDRARQQRRIERVSSRGR